ncbi:MAG: DUF4345 family protein, partial [Pseudomonadota bacterium]
MRLLFQTVFLCVAFVPFALGALSLIQGASRLVPPDLVTAQLDGQIRFWGIRSMLPFLLALWIARNLDRAYGVLAIVLGATAAGGIARAMSAYLYGSADPALVATISFEVALSLSMALYGARVRLRLWSASWATACPFMGFLPLPISPFSG